MRYLILTIIVILSIFIRSYNIGNYPEINADEAALAYNAYSLVSTGADEFGTSWPFTFRSFDDYKPGVYVYLVLPFIKTLGLNTLSIRLPSLIMSAISIWTLYFLVQRMFSTSRHRVAIGLVASLTLALMPWHIHFSRGAWETQVAASFLLLGTYFFSLLPKKHFYIYLGIAFYALSLYTYHSMRVLVPLFFVFWAIRYHRTWRKHIAFALVSTLAVGLCFLPLAIQISNRSGLSRAQGVSIFADSGPTWRSNELRSLHKLPSPIWIRLAYNKPVFYAQEFFANYLSHFSLHYLFYDGDVIERSRVPEFGQLLLVAFPFLIAGLWYLVRQSPKRLWLLIFWLLVAPIPAALTFQSPHAVRSFAMTIPLAMILAYGIVNSLSAIKQNFGRIVFAISIFLFASLFAWDFSRYLVNYYLLLPYQLPNATQIGFNQLVPYVEARKSEYDQIYITDRYDQPYILFLYFSQYPPMAFQPQAEISSSSFGFGTVAHYDKYNFGPIDYAAISQTDKKTLIVGTDAEIPAGANTINIIKDKYGRIIFKIAKINLP